MSNVDKYAQAISEGILGFKSKKEKKAEAAEKASRPFDFEQNKKSYVYGSELLAQHTQKMHDNISDALHNLNNGPAHMRLQHIEKLKNSLNDAYDEHEYGYDHPDSIFTRVDQAITAQGTSDHLMRKAMEAKIDKKTGKLSDNDKALLHAAYEKHANPDNPYRRRHAVGPDGRAYVKQNY